MTLFKTLALSTALAGALLATAAQAAEVRIALVAKSLGNGFFEAADKGAEEAAKQIGDVKIVYTGPTTTTAEGQIEVVNSLISQKVDAIVIAPADSKALIPVCKRAQAAGILVVNIDNKFDTGVLGQEKIKIPFVGPDNRKGAEKVGEYVAKQLQAGAKVGVLEGLPGAFNGIQRTSGFDDALKAAKLDVVSSQAADWETAKANQVASAMITQHPDLAAIFCDNDSMVLGAVAALKAAGKEGSVKVAGFDNIAAVQQLIKDGKVAATADQHGDQLAAFGIEYALDGLKNKGQAAADKETAVDLVDKDTLK